MLAATQGGRFLFPRGALSVAGRQPHQSRLIARHLVIPRTYSAQHPALSLVLRMKRLFQFVAVLVIAFLAVQPAQALINCAFEPSPIASACPMEMSGMNAMGVGCPMSNNMETSGCAQDCCTHPAAASATAIAAPVKPRLNLLPQHLEQQLAIPTAQPVDSDSPLAPPTFRTPRYILHQAFRI
jgi:hypothetical protein